MLNLGYVRAVDSRMVPTHVAGAFIESSIQLFAEIKVFERRFPVFCSGQPFSFLFLLFFSNRRRRSPSANSRKTRPVHKQFRVSRVVEPPPRVVEA